MHDVLTGLPNRALFVDRLEQALARSERTDGLVAVIFLDLDRFKTINDSLGHDAGDRVLVEVAARLQDVVRPSDTLARFGGDEYTVLCEPTSAYQGLAIADRLAVALSVPIESGGHEVFLTASVGIAFGRHGDQPADLIRDADSAMYKAKERGPGEVETFDVEMRTRALRRLEVEHDLHRAVERDELRLYWQPIVELDTRNIVAAEALFAVAAPRARARDARRVHSRRDGDRADRANRSVGGRERLRAAQALAAGGADRARLRRLGQRVGPRDRDGSAGRERARRARALWRGSLGALPGGDRARSDERDRSHARRGQRASRPRRAVALDDFGTGHSSLLVLKRLPIQTVKVDRAFVQGLDDDDGQDAAIVEAVASLAHALGLSAVAEGIETETQRRKSQELGCDLGQGFLFARPQPAAEMSALLDQARTRAELSYTRR